MLVLPFYANNSAYAQTPAPSPQTSAVSNGTNSEKLNCWAAGVFPRVFDAACISWIFFEIAYIVAYIGGVVVQLTASIFDWLINPSNFPYARAEGVIQGWKIFRDLVNLIFILVLLIIAFATIFKSERFGMKQLLWRLILAALLVNFSLMIGGVFIDTANSFTTFFMSKAFTCEDASGNLFTNPQSCSIATKIASIASFQSIFKPTQQTGLNGVEDIVTNLFKTNPERRWSIILIALGSIFFALIFISIMIIVMVAFILMLFVRIGMLWFLLMLAPLAWVSWILPFLEKHWQNWWSHFFRWTFFAPLVVLFVFLGFKIMEVDLIQGGVIPNSQIVEFQTLKSPTAESAQADFQSFFTPLTEAGLPSKIVQLLLGLSTMIFGLFLANSLSITFAEGAIGAVKHTVSSIGLIPLTGTKAAALAAARSRWATRAGAGALGGLERSFLGRIPILGGAISGARGGLITKTRKEQEAHEKEFSNRQPAEEKQLLFNRIRSVGVADSTIQAYLNRVKEIGALTEFLSEESPAKQQKYLQMLHEYKAETFKDYYYNEVGPQLLYKYDSKIGSKSIIPISAAEISANAIRRGQRMSAEDMSKIDISKEYRNAEKRGDAKLIGAMTEMLQNMEKRALAVAIKKLAQNPTSFEWMQRAVQNAPGSGASKPEVIKWLKSKGYVDEDMYKKEFGVLDPFDVIGAAGW